MPPKRKSQSGMAETTQQDQSLYPKLSAARGPSDPNSGDEDQDLSNSTLDDTQLGDISDFPGVVSDKAASSESNDDSFASAGSFRMDSPSSRQPIGRRGRSARRQEPNTSPAASIQPQVSPQGYDFPDRGSRPSSSRNRYDQRQHRTSQSSGHQGYTPHLRDSHRPSPSDRQTPQSFEDFVRANLVILVAALILLVCVVGFSFFTSPAAENNPVGEPAAEVPVRERMVSSFSRSLRAARQSFTEQSKRHWATVAATTKSVLKTETPFQPGIILMAGSNASMITVHCLETQLSKAITNSYEDARETVRINIDTTHLSLSHADLKLLIDNEFKAGLSSGSRVAVLRNLHKVPGKAAMMFHAYCDNESAPFKDSIIIFTFVLDMQDSDFHKLDDVELARLVEDQLQKKWQREIGIDNTMALLSRVANNIAVVRPESHEVLKSQQCL